MAQAEWQENRGGELYFVEADMTVAGWVFSERSTYETRWFRVPPKTGWIERAERVFAKSRAKVPVNGHGPRRSANIADAEAGDFHDNASTLAIAGWRIDNGAITEGLAMLYRLQDHIAAIDEEKSRIILLPAVEKEIERAYRRQQALDQTDDPPRRPPSPASGPTTSMSREPGTGHGDLASRVKSHLIDAVGLVTALCWTHSILVHEITTLSGLGAHPAGANLASASLLAIMVRVAAKGIR